MKNRKNKDTNRAADIEIRSEKLAGKLYDEKTEDKPEVDSCVTPGAGHGAQAKKESGVSNAGNDTGRADTTGNGNENDKAKEDDTNGDISNSEKDGSAVLDGKVCGKAIKAITIIGQIEGHYMLSDAQKTTKYEHIIPELAECEESPDIGGLLILINTMGGDVEAGLAISEMISGMSKPSVSLILGGGHSIGAPLAVSADFSFIVPTATITLHPVRLNGLVIGSEQSFVYFRKMQERIIRFIVRNSDIDENVLRTLIMNTDEIATDMGTIIDGKEAVSLGLINQIGGISDALSTLKKLISKEIPKKQRKTLL